MDILVGATHWYPICSVYKCFRHEYVQLQSTTFCMRSVLLLSTHPYYLILARLLKIRSLASFGAVNRYEIFMTNSQMAKDSFTGETKTIQKPRLWAIIIFSFLALFVSSLLCLFYSLSKYKTCMRYDLCLSTFFSFCRSFFQQQCCS